MSSLSDNGVIMKRFIFILTLLWTFPTTLVGLSLGCIGTLFGARWQIRCSTLECYGGGLGRVLLRWPWPRSGINAITFGDVILGQSAAALEGCRAHEQIHVRQAHRWGPLFLPAYLLASAWAKIRGRDPYRDNPFEVQAYREAT